MIVERSLELKLVLEQILTDVIILIEGCIHHNNFLQRVEVSATSCKNDHIILWCTNDVILWHKLKSALKAMRLPLSDLIVNMFSNARQQERVDRLKTLIKIEKDRPEFAQDKKMIANYESLIEYLCIIIKLNR